MVKIVFSTLNRLNIPHSKQMCNLLEIPMPRVHIDVLRLPEIAKTWNRIAKLSNARVKHINTLKIPL